MMKNINENAVLPRGINVFPWLVCFCWVGSDFVEAFKIGGNSTKSNRQRTVVQNPTVYLDVVAEVQNHRPLGHATMLQAGLWFMGGMRGCEVGSLACDEGVREAVVVR
jgi:hypothetical protein